MNILDDRIARVLSNAGLSPSEAKIYVMARGLVCQSKEITTKTHLPRATVQAGLSALEDAGLCKVTKKDNKTNYYQMLPLSNLKKLLTRDIQRTNQLMGELDQLERMDSDTPTLITQSANSQDGVIEFLNMALYSQSGKWNLISPYDNALRHLPTSYISYFKKIRKEREIASQTLWEKEWQKVDINLSQLLMRKPRFVPSNIAQKVPALIMTFDDNLLVISGKSNPYAEMITSQQVVDTFNIIFELAWRSCKVEQRSHTLS